MPKLKSATNFNNRQTDKETPRAAKGFLSVGKAAKFLQLSPDTLRNWEKQGKLIPIRTIGGARRYSNQQLQAVKKELYPAGIPQKGLLTVSKAAKMLHVSPDTIRHWEKKGAIQASRSKGGIRRFTKQEVTRLQNELGISQQGDINLNTPVDLSGIKNLLEEARDDAVEDKTSEITEINLLDQLKKVHWKKIISSTTLAGILIILAIMLRPTGSPSPISFPTTPEKEQDQHNKLVDLQKENKSQQDQILAISKNLESLQKDLYNTNLIFSDQVHPLYGTEAFIGGATIDSFGSIYPTKRTLTSTQAKTTGSLGTWDHQFSELFVNGFDVRYGGDTTIKGKTTLGDDSGDHVTFNGHVYSNIIPSGTDNFNLGSSSNNWYKAYISNIYGSNINYYTANINRLNVATSATFGTNILPQYDTTYDLGSTSLRWNKIWAQNGDFSGDVRIGDALTVEGSLTVSGTTLATTGNIETSGNLTVDGNTILGNATSDTATITGTTTINLPDNTSPALDIQQGTDNYINISTSDSTPSVLIDLPVAGSTSTTANLFTSNLAKTINLGTGTAADTINIGTDGTTADDINLGGLATSTVDVLGVTKLGDGGSTNYAQFSATGDLTFVGSADTITANNASTWSTSNGLLTITGDDGVTINATSTAGITANIPDTLADAFDLQQGTSNYLNINTLTEVMQFGNATTNPTFGFLGTGAVTIAGSAEGTNALVLTAGDLRITDGDLIVTAGDFSFTGATGVINLSSTLSIDSTDTTNLTMTANDAGNKTLTISATNAGVGAGLITVSSDGDLSLDTSGGTLYLNNTNNRTINTGTGDFVADTTGTFSAISAATINLGTADVGSTVQIGTNSTTADTITIGNSNAATTLALTGGDDWNITTAGAAAFAASVGITGTEGSSVFTVTAGDAVISDGSLSITDDDDASSFSVTNNTITTANLATISSSSLTTGTALALSSTATSFNGELLTLSKTATTGSTAFTSDIANVTYSQTFDGGVALNSTGNVLDLSRAITMNNLGNTHTISGALVTIADSGVETAGDINNTSNILSLAQNCGTGVTCSGAVLKITNSGSGADISLANAETISNSTDGTIAFGADKLTLGTAAVSGNLLTASYAGAATQTGALTGISFDTSTNVTVPNTSSGNQTGLTLTVKDGGSSATAIGIALNGTYDRGIDFSAGTVSSGGSFIYNDTSSTIDLAAAADNVLEVTNSSGTTSNDNIITLEIDANTDASDKILFRVVSNVGGTEQTKFTIDSDGDISATNVTVVTDLSCTNCLDFTDFEDTLDLDNNLTLNQTTYTWGQTFTGDTTVGLTYTANSLTTGTAARITSSSAVTTGGELLDLVGNGITTGNMITASATALTSGSLLSFTGPSGATVGVTGNIAALTSDVGNAGAIINSTATFDSTGVAASSYNTYLSTTNSNSTNANSAYGLYSTLSDAIALPNTDYGVYSTVSNTGVNTLGTKTTYGVYGASSNLSTGVGGSANTYGGYFTATGDTGGTSTAYGIYATATGADTIYGIDIGAITTTNSTTSYGINVGALSGSGTTNYGINVTASTATGTNNYGINVGALTGAGTNNYGVYINAPLNGGTTNIGLYNAGTTTLVGAVTFDGAQTFNADVDFVFAGNENATITNTTNTLGASGMLDLASTGSTTDTRTLDLLTTFSSTGATTSYGLYNAWASTAVVTGVGVSQTAYGNYTTTTKTGADDATGTYTLYGNYATASNTGRTAAGTVTTYGGYFTATGDAAGATTTTGLYTSALGADINYGIQVAAMTGATSTGLDIGALSGATANTGINVGAISGSGTTNYGINVTASTATGTNNYGINVGALTGAGTNNYGIYINTPTSASGANAALATAGGYSLFGTGTKNTKNLGGVTLQQGTADDEILSLKSSDINQDQTGFTEADTYALFKKNHATAGGLQIFAPVVTGNTVTGINLYTVTTGDTTKTSTSVGALQLWAAGYGAPGGGGGQFTDAGNLLIIGNNATNHFIFDENGKMYVLDSATGAQGVYGAAYSIASGNANGISYQAGQLAITGASTTYFENKFLANSVTAATALTIDNAATVYIDAAPAAVGVGPATITNAYALWVDTGNARFDGDLVTGSTTLNVFNDTATTLSFGGAATTQLNLGNGTGNYTAINIGSGTGTHVINIAGTGATGADTINIGTGGTGADTINIGSSASTTSIALTSGTGSQTFTSSVVSGTTTTSAFVFAPSAITTGTGIYASSSTLSSGSLVDLAITGTAGLTNQKGINVSLSGANATGAQTTYGGYFSNTHTGTSTNVGLYATATGGSNNYAAIFEAGNVGIGTTAPGAKLQIDPLRVGTQATPLIVNALTSAAVGEAQFWMSNVDTATSVFRLMFGSGNGTRIAGVKGNNNAGRADLIFETYSSATGNLAERMAIDTSGNVGIGTVTPTGTLEVKSASANILVAGLNGVTNPAFNVDASTASSATGINIKSAAAAGGVALAVISSDTDENLKIDAKGAGTVSIGATSTGDVLLAGGSGAFGCTVTNSNGDLTCTGNLTGSTAGTVGFWARATTTLSPATANDIVSIANTTTSGADLAVTNTGIYTGTGIVNITADSTTAGTVLALSADALTTGKAIDLTSTSNAWDSGTLLNVSSSQTAATDTSLSADTANISFSPTYSTAVTTPSITGQVLDISRSTTTNNLFASTLTVSGAVVSISDTSTQTTGTLTHSGNVLSLTQNYGTTTGAILSLTPPATTNAGGTLEAINIGNITTSSGTDLALTFGTGWDTDINATTSLEIGIGGTNELTLTATDLAPSTDGTSALGTTALAWNSLHLNTGTAINWENSDVTLTHATNTLTLAGASSGYVFNDGNVYINDTANAQMTTGLTINQGAADNEILAFKSSDIAHGVTARAETDTYAFFRKANATAGGLYAEAIVTEGTAEPAMLFSVGATGDTAKTTAGRGMFEIDSYLSSPTGGSNSTVNANIFAIRRNGSTRLIVNDEGQIYVMGSATSSSPGIFGAALSIASGSTQGVSYQAGQLTITGASTTYFQNKFLKNSVTAATALTIDNAATVYIDNAPNATGAGPAAITNAYALWVDAGTTRFDGTIDAQGDISDSSGNLTLNDAVDIATSLTIAGSEGSTVFTITAGDAAISDGSLTITDDDDASSFSVTNNTITTGVLASISSSSLTSGTALALSSTATSFNGELLTLSKTGASGSTSFTSDIANVTYTQTFNGTGTTNTGNVLDISRAITVDDGTAGAISGTVSGAVITVSDNCTAGTADTCTHSGDILSLTQSYGTTTGAILSLTPPATTNAGGTLEAINIGNITTSSGTDLALTFGTGWDSDINATTSLEIGIGGTNEVVLSATALYPATNDGNALGAVTTGEWSDLFLASGGVINWANDVTITHASNALTIAGGDTFIADGNGLVVGHSAQIAISDGGGATGMTPEAQILGISRNDSTMLLASFDTSAAGFWWVSPNLAFLRGGGAAIGDVTIVADTQTLGEITWYGADGVDLKSVAAKIAAVVEGTPGAGDMPGALVFYTTLDGTEDPSNNERMRITNAGNIGIGTNSPDARLEINHATGDSLRLTYNDSNGSAVNYTDFSLSSTGALTLTGSAATLAASATAEKTFLTLTPGVITLTAPTAVTSLMETAVLTGATIAADAATTVDKATGLSLTAPIDSTNATITDSSALRILNITSGAGTLTNQYGIYIEAPTGGATTNIGLYNGGTSTLAGAATINTSLLPDADDGATLGLSGTGFSDLFLASGAVINFAAGDVTLTHSADVLALDGGSFVVNEASGAIDVPFRVESDNNANLIYTDGTFAGGIGFFAIGKTTSQNAGVSIGFPARTTNADTDYSIVEVLPTGAVTIPAGTTPLVGSMTLNEPNITATGTVTNAFTLRIVGAPTEGSNNYALWVDAGTSAFGGAIIPDTNNGAALGAASTGEWSDLFLAEGGIINWDNSDMTLTQVGDKLTIAGGNTFIADGDGLVIGHTAQISATSTAPEFQILGTALADGSMTIGRFGTQNEGPIMSFTRSPNTTIGSHTIVADNDVLGVINWDPDDGVDFDTESARFQAEVDDGSPAAGDIGTAFVWKSMPGGGAAQREVMRITASGIVGIGTATPLSGAFLDVTGDGTGSSDTAGQFVIRGKTTTTKQLRFMIDTTANVGKIAAANNGVEWYNLALQPDGGSVGIGDASPASLLTVGANDAFQVNSTGAIAAATGVTSSGTITFSDLTNCNTIDTGAGGILACGKDAGAEYTAYTADGTWTKSDYTGPTLVIVEAFGAGGGGGGGKGGAGGSSRPGGGAGGGGVRARQIISAAALGTTETVTVGTGGPAGGGGSSADGSNGTVGENSSFGSFLTAYGGGGGQGGNTTSVRGGGGGGTGSAGQTATGIAGGDPNPAFTGTNPSDVAAGAGGDGSIGGDTAHGGNAEYGGGGGGSTCTGDCTGSAGGSSIYGGAGGGGGGNVVSGNQGRNAGAGGTSNSYTAGSGGTAGVADGGAGGTGSDGSNGYGGAGGGGGAGYYSSTGGAGGAGGAPAGGGGGGGGGFTTGGAGAAGARGEVRVWTVTGGTGADLAEIYYSLDMSLEPADVVAADPDLPGIGFKKSDKAYDGKVLGIMTTKPGLVMGDEEAPDLQGKIAKPVMLALAGRVPVKVSTENGQILIGDYLTSSSVPGVAMKATRPGPTVGKALEKFDCNTITSPESAPVCSGKITVFVNVSYGDPGDFFSSLTMDDQGNLIIPKLKADKLVLNYDFNIQAPAENSLLAYENSTSLDGTVSFGIEVVKSLQNLEAKATDLEEKQASSSAQLADLKNNVASSSAILTAQIASLSAQLAKNTPEVKLTPPDVLLATGSAILANLKVTSEATMSGRLVAYDLSAQNTFKSLGETSLGNTTVAGTFSIDGTFSVNGNSINVIGYPSLQGDALEAETGILYLQNSALAQAVDIFNGKVVIDKDGNVKANSIIVADFKGVTNKVTGSGTLTAGNAWVDVNSINVKSNSRILVTPTSSTDLILIVSQKVEGEKFRVQIAHSTNNDINFDWFVINEVDQ